MAKSQFADVDRPAEEQTADPLAFFREARGAFERAAQAAGGTIERFYTIAGDAVRLRFAGPALAPALTPALDHLGAGPHPAPALTVCLWDSEATGVAMPPPPWGAEDYVARGEIRGYSTDRIRTAFQQGACSLSMLDVEQSSALYWIRDARRVPSWETAAPLRTVLHWWMGTRGRQLVHAAAVGTPAGGVLLAGKGGSGKSTTALACLESDLLYLSDDYTLLSADPMPYAHSLYSSAKVDAAAAQRLPHLTRAVAEADRFDCDKALIFVAERYPEKMARGFPTRAILLPRVTHGSHTSVRETSSAAGLRALAASTVFQLAGAGHRDLQAVAALVRRTPCFDLLLGQNVGDVPQVIADLLARGACS